MCRCMHTQTHRCSNKTDTQAHRHSHTDMQTYRLTDTWAHSRQHKGGGLPDASPATPGAPVGNWKDRCDPHQLVSSEPYPRPQLPLQGSLREHFTTKQIIVMTLDSVLQFAKPFCFRCQGRRGHQDPIWQCSGVGDTGYHAADST